ncbi:MAG: prepilin-type N-terminal cleavage/methylation domain-containing protein [Longimicrobiales bacterium]|nr:prepilin-type N-terminal cleavage/methylation domain-containing protein [Longimicrobiales bacterium]
MKTDHDYTRIRHARGFTLVEFLVVAVIGSLLVMATYQVLITNRRTFTVQNAQLQNQQQLRASLEVLLSELRQVSARGGDLVSISSNALQTRTMEEFGLVCDVTYGPVPVLKVKRFTGWFEAGDSVFVFAENRPNRAGDDAWLLMTVTASDPTTTCDGTDLAQNLAFSGFLPLMQADSVREGAPVRNFTHHTWRASIWNGDYYLTRQRPGEPDPVPIVGPLIPGSRSRNPVSFRYLDANGTPTTTITDIRQIEVKVFTWSPVVDQNGANVQDSLVLRTYTRN